MGRMVSAEGAATAERPPGYSRLTKVLHWTMVAALAAQFVVGYALDRADDLLDWAVDAFLGGDDERLLVVHLVLGVIVLVLAVVRLLWRRASTLPAWAPGLSAFERRFAHAVERALYWLMFGLPLSGLALLLLSDAEWEFADGGGNSGPGGGNSGPGSANNGGGGGAEWTSPWPIADDIALLVVHIALHIAFFVTLALHVGLVLKHQFLRSDRLLNRML